VSLRQSGEPPRRESEGFTSHISAYAAFPGKVSNHPSEPKAPVQWQKDLTVDPLSRAHISPV